MAVRAGNPEKVFKHPTKGIYHLRQIYLMRPDGTGHVNLTTDPMLDNYEARFSPEGKRIAYGQRKDQDGRVLYADMICGRDGKGLKQVISFSEFYKGNHEYKPNGPSCWSPDGKQIVWLIPRRKTQHSVSKDELLFVSPETGIQKRVGLRELGIGWATCIEWR